METRGQIFNPAVEDYETLKEGLVEREDELETIFDRLKAADLEGTSRSFILIGQRGAGKTHLLLRIYHEIKEQKELSNKYASIKFSEEEYVVHSLADLLVRILEELKEETKEGDIENKIEELLSNKKKLEDEELIEKSESIFETFLENYEKKIVLCADNLDDIFDNISGHNETSLKHLRSILQSEDYMIIIGSASTYFEEIKNHEEPFYNFFEIIRVESLSPEGVENLIKKLAEMEGDDHIIENFEEYKPKIETIVHFTGGLPRLVRMLYYVIAKAEMTEVVDLLEKLLDELTPYYQSKMKNLSGQRQKIIDIMASMDGPATPTEIAEEGRMDRGSVNTTLRKLDKEGLVSPVKQEKRKSTRYDITERMFRIWRQMRQTKGKNRIKYLADFLEAFYTTSDFKKHLKKMDEKFSGPLQEEGGKEKSIREYELLKEIAPEEILPDLKTKLIDKYIKTGKIEKAEKELEDIKKKKLDPEHEIAFKSLGECYILGMEIDEFLKWFEERSKSEEDFSSLFEDWVINDDLKISKTIKFLTKTESIKREEKEFIQFWKELLRHTIEKILILSVEDSKDKNFGQSQERLELLFENQKLWMEEDIEVNDLFLDYFIELLKIDINHSEDIFEVFKNEIGEDFQKTFKILENVIIYLKSKDQKILEKLFPEEREVVEELIEDIENDNID